MYSRNCEGGNRLQQLCESHALQVITTQFKPKSKQGGGKGKGKYAFNKGNATFRPRNALAAYSQIDHILGAKRYTTDFTQCRVRWDHSVRFGTHHDHARIEVTMSIKLQSRPPPSPQNIA